MLSLSQSRPKRNTLNWRVPANDLLCDHKPHDRPPARPADSTVKRQKCQQAEWLILQGFVPRSSPQLARLDSWPSTVVVEASLLTHPSTNSRACLHRVTHTTTITLPKDVPRNTKTVLQSRRAPKCGIVVQRQTSSIFEPNGPDRLPNLSRHRPLHL